jgi:hypothetical protein
MPGLRLRALALRVAADSGQFGADLRFGAGLNVLRADNSSGKSTCIMAILYGLGLEGMISASHQPPLPPVMTSELFGVDGRASSVLESQVMLEIENANGDPLTVQRWVRHSQYRPNLIRAWRERLLSDGVRDDVASTDYFVRQQGAATNVRGFHTFLASFIDFELPVISRNDGTEGPLYLECIFPAFVVEQKRGWGGVLQQMPYYLGIPEMGKRAVEFLLDLDSYELARRRRQLEQSEAQLRSDWRAIVQRLVGEADALGGALRGVPSTPQAIWPPSEPVTIVLPAESTWEPIDEVLQRERTLLASALSDEIPIVDDAAGAIQADLAAAETELAQLSAVAVTFIEEVASGQAQLASIDARIGARRIDLQRYRDLRTLRRLGSDSDPVIDPNECPTCHQDLPQALVGLVDTTLTMSVDDNIRYIEQQQTTFADMRRAAESDFESKRLRLTAIRSRSNELRSRIRSSRRTLTTSGQQPAAEAIERRVRIGQRVEALERLSLILAGLLVELEETAEEWRKVLSEREALRGMELSTEDEDKLSELEITFRDELAEYAFSSLPISDVGISRIKYTPEHQGFDLGSDVSASDMIRAIWAYVLGLIEVGRTAPTNHPGLLILDEPRQQDTDPRSFEAFLKRAGRSNAFGQQVLCATSEADENVRKWLEATPHNYLPFSGRIIQPRP